MKEKPRVYLANTNLSFVQVIFVFETINTIFRLFLISFLPNLSDLAYIETLTQVLEGTVVLCQKSSPFCFKWSTYERKTLCLLGQHQFSFQVIFVFKKINENPTEG